MLIAITAYRRRAGHGNLLAIGNHLLAISFSGDRRRDGLNPLAVFPLMISASDLYAHEKCE